MPSSTEVRRPDVKPKSHQDANSDTGGTVAFESIKNDQFSGNETTPPAKGCFSRISFDTRILADVTITGSCRCPSTGKM